MRCNLFLGAISSQERDAMDMKVSFWNAEQAYHFFVLPSSKIYKLGEYNMDVFSYTLLYSSLFLFWMVVGSII